MFRSLSFAGVLMLGSLTAFEVSAQRYDDGRYRPDPVYDDGHYRPGDYQNGSGPAYDYARVVRVDPIIVGSGQGAVSVAINAMTAVMSMRVIAKTATGATTITVAATTTGSTGREVMVGVSWRP